MLLKDLHVLVVDDIDDSRALISFALTFVYHATVTQAASGSEALEAIKQSRPDVLISDLYMPEMDGYTLIGQVRALSPEQGGQIPAIAFTAYDTPEHRRRALDAGFQQYVPKPVDPTKLAITIADLIGQDRLDANR